MEDSHRAQPPPGSEYGDYSGRRRATRANAGRPIPVVTATLLLVITGIFLAMVRAGHGNVMTVALQFGVKDVDLIRNGEWWRLITAIFLHGSWIHLLVNGMSLFWMGSQMEQIYGGRRYFLIFMVAGVAGNLFSYWRLPTPSLGASGSLFGLVGAGIVFPLRYRDLINPEARNSILRQLITIAGINFAISSSSPGIDNWAHFGGFLGGGFVALFLMPVALDRRPRSVAREAALNIIVALTLAITLLAAGLQWRAARNEGPEEEKLTYSPAGSNPWWSFQLSARWQAIHPAGESGIEWVTADHSNLKVREISLTLDIQQVALALGHDEALQAQLVGNQSALISTAVSEKGFQDFCVVAAYGHELSFEMSGPQPAYRAAHQDFKEMLASVHFAHAPPSPPQGNSPASGSPGAP